MSALAQMLLSSYAGAPAGADPHFSGVQLLLHFDGADGATTTTDSSANARAVSLAGGAQIMAGALLLDGSGDYASVAHSSLFSFVSVDFTVEAQFNTTSNSVTRYIVQKGGASFVSYPHWGLSINPAGQVLAQLGRAESSGPTRHLLTSTATVNDGADHHVAFCRTGSSLRLFVDGVQQGAAVTVSVTPLDSASYGVGIGTYFASPANDWQGSIDELRITRGVGRYTATFTPPAAPHPNY